MIFNTIGYLVFLAVTVAAYWVLPPRLRLSLLLVASLLFYGLWRVEFVALISFSALVDFYFSLRIHDTENERWRRIYMVTSVSINLALLLFFKYTYFIVDNLSLLTGFTSAEARVSIGNIILPLGISFYTFLSISYTIDVYRREFVPIRNFAHYLNYVMFWPHMIAGPILRASELIPQFFVPPRPDSETVARALQTILFGLFLKVGLADHLAPLVDEAFLMPPHALGGLDVWTMAFAFGLQIYFDFAGYSMIAIGSAALVGIAFPQNFDWPYLASSPREFWRRWHITLSSWIRDYLYLPLSGLRATSHSSGGIDIQFQREEARQRGLGATPALFLAWFIMGLWHGASWNFALWGLWHAAFIFLFRTINPYLPERPGLLGAFTGWGVTLTIAMLGWIPFRSPDVATTFALYSRLLDVPSYLALGFRENTYLVVFCMFAGMIALYRLKRIDWEVSLGTPGRSLRAAGMFSAVTAAAFVVFIFLRPVAQFIYFQF